MPSVTQDLTDVLPPSGSFVRVLVDDVPRWAWAESGTVKLLDADVDLARLVSAPSTVVSQLIDAAVQTAADSVRLLAPVDATTEVWAAGVTYEKSREARVSESIEPDIYVRVYDAARPELFFKAVGWRVRGPQQTVSVRVDSQWNVPEPELAAILRSDRSVFGWTICNDVSSRSIEGENPLYLPQAKVYAGSCAVGPAILPADALPDPYHVVMRMSVERDGAEIWSGTSSTEKLRRHVDELAEHLFAAQEFPGGVVLSTGTSLVPDAPFTLRAGDTVRIRMTGIGELATPVVAGIPQSA